MVLRRGVMRRQAILVWAVLCCLAFLLCTSTAFGQAVYGSIIGTVTDPQGNAVAGGMVARPSATQNTMGLRRSKTISNNTRAHPVTRNHQDRIEQARASHTEYNARYDI